MLTRYAPSLVLLAWAILALIIGERSLALTICGLVSTAAAFYFSVRAGHTAPAIVDAGHRRRQTDRGWRILVRENAYRDVWLIAITVLCLVAIDRTDSKVERQREGRATANAIVCGAVSAVIDAGQATITGSSAGGGSEEFLRNLEKLGYPPENVRKAQAEKAARAYARSIAERVEKQAGAEGEGIVRPDGSIDCKKLARVTAATPE